MTEITSCNSLYPVIPITALVEIIQYASEETKRTKKKRGYTKKKSIEMVKELKGT